MIDVHRLEVREGVATAARPASVISSGVVKRSSDVSVGAASARRA